MQRKLQRCHYKCPWRYLRSQMLSFHVFHSSQCVLWSPSKEEVWFNVVRNRMPPSILVAVCILVVCLGVRGWEQFFLQERNEYSFATPFEYRKVPLQRNRHVMYPAEALYREWIIYWCAWLWKHFFSITFSIYLDTKRCNTCIHYGKCLFPVLFWCWK